VHSDVKAILHEDTTRGGVGGAALSFVAVPRPAQTPPPCQTVARCGADRPDHLATQPRARSSPHNHQTPAQPNSHHHRAAAQPDNRPTRQPPNQTAAQPNSHTTGQPPDRATPQLHNSTTRTEQRTAAQPTHRPNQPHQHKTQAQHPQEHLRDIRPRQAKQAKPASPSHYPTSITTRPLKRSSSARLRRPGGAGVGSVRRPDV
jgi:hypothetical protein